MKKLISLCMLGGALVACTRAEYVDNVEYYDDGEIYAPLLVTADMADVPESSGTSEIKYSVPRDGDLTLETRHHVIQIHGDPNAKYEYRVWAGDKTYDDDADLIVDDGNIMVLKSE